MVVEQGNSDRVRRRIFVSVPGWTGRFSDLHGDFLKTTALELGARWMLMKGNGGASEHEAEPNFFAAACLRRTENAT